MRSFIPKCSTDDRRKQFISTHVRSSQKETQKNVFRSRALSLARPLTPRFPRTRALSPSCFRHGSLIHCDRLLLAPPFPARSLLCAIRTYPRLLPYHRCHTHYLTQPQSRFPAPLSLLSAPRPPPLRLSTRPIAIR